MSAARLRSPRSAAISLLAPLALVAVAVMIGASGPASLRDSVTLILCNLVIVCGLQVFIGNSGVYSFGQLGFAALGAYLGALMTLPPAFAALQVPGAPGAILHLQPGPLLGTAIAAIAAGLVAALVGLALMRTSTLAIPISTFAFLIVTYNVLANWDRVSGGSAGLVSIPRSTGLDAAGLWAGGAVVVALCFKWSASGYRLRATREDEVAAQAIGVGVMRERLLAFSISGALCGAGGALAVHQSGVLGPQTFYFGATVTTLTMLVLGGSGSVFGAVLGTLCVATITELLRGLEEGASLFGVVSIGETPGLAAIGLGVILLGTMILAPKGLSRGREAGELGKARRRPTPTVGRPPEEESYRPKAAEGTGSGLLATRVSVSFGGLRVLRDVDLRLSRGEALGLIGPNGAGKTTLLNVLSGFQRPHAGVVEVDGTDVSASPPARLARLGLGRTFQAALPFPQLSVLEGVAVGAMAVGVKRGRAAAIAEEVLARLGLEQLGDLAASSLPAGRQRLAGIARALAGGPRYLLLDEPAAGLSEGERVELVAALRGVLVDFGCGILLVEHDMNVVGELCPRVQVLDDGATVALGTPAEVQVDPLVVKSYLGSSFPEVDVA